MTHDNTAVRKFVRCFWNATDMTTEHPGTDDILSGALALKTQGDTGTRSLSRSRLFGILSSLDRITVHDVQSLPGPTQAERTHQRYAEAARVASKALAPFVAAMTYPERNKKFTSRMGCMLELDAPYSDDARKAEALSLSARAKHGVRPGRDTLPPIAQREAEAARRFAAMCGAGRTSGHAQA